MTINSLTKNKTMTIRETMQGQIDVLELRDLNEKMKPETLWGLIVFKFPYLKSKYSLDSECNWNDIVSEVVSVASALAMRQKNIHF